MYLKLPLFFLMYFVFCGPAQAQRMLRTTQSYYHSLLADSCIQTAADWHLKGNIKSVTEININNRDTTVLKFNPDGTLGTKVSHEDPYRNYGEDYRYQFDHGILKQIWHAEINSSISQVFFGSNGMVEKSITQWIQYKDTNRQESAYSYKDSGGKLYVTIRHAYNFDTSKWDVAIADKYVFAFNKRHQVIHESMRSRHKETTYGYHISFLYDSASGNLVQIAHNSNCAGMNSCLFYDEHLQYDSLGNVTGHQLYDHTVRNALWSYSYAWSATYNEHHDEVTKVFYNTDLPFPLQKQGDSDSSKNTNQPIYYAYEYDANGNWVKRFVLDGHQEKILELYRNIEYDK